MIIYLTLGDQPSGVFRSQVEDFVKFLAKLYDQPVRLVSFISFRNFGKNRRLIKLNLPNAIVLPMFPQLRNWRINRFLLYLITLYYQPKCIFARNVLACQLSLSCKNSGLVRKVIYDGRGAISAEWKEYNVVDDIKLTKDIFLLEQEAVTKSDFQLAVSTKLVEFWQTSFNFTGINYSVVPCTISDDYHHLSISSESIKKLKKDLGFTETSIVIVFSGSIAGWQNANVLENFLNERMINQPEIELLFLSKETPLIANLKIKFPERVFQKFLSPDQVKLHLMACDYGMLIRDDTITNQVASPVKFAEYLSCGLKVIISENIGDYSTLVKENALGHLYNEIPEKLESIDMKERLRLRSYALKYFVRDNYLDVYKHILDRVK